MIQQGSKLFDRELSILLKQVINREEHYKESYIY